jgi:hypothetical protein
MYLKMYIKEIGWEVRKGQALGFCGHDNDPTDYIKCGLFLD